ncbi:uncharacterized protein LOC110683373 [Chenopodium quinoa]|uniref:uncharacterized protein LOC110683373 n=1 Tax=Chenopodium quinoa TaxID=63459 RepID=UPI000B794BFC|nr:uncharacterized protein LOC110683373 [Chenopodium quinoa]
MDAFRGAIDSCAMKDLCYRGCTFTWERGNSMSTFVRERLDRFLADEGWCSLFPDCEVRHLSILKPDHAPIILSTETRRQDDWGDSGFKFEHFWLSNEGCSGVVSDAWRLITDNSIVAFEIFHAMKRGGEGKDGNVALKLDMSKAYHRVEWINGHISGSVTPSRGLRQGDPISPYLFLLYADAFSTLISKAANGNLIYGARICRNAPRVSHLFFADDSILFAKARVQEFSVIADIINKYERASVQNVNLSKTEVVFSKNVDQNRRQEIIQILGVREVERHEKYLGLPTIIGRSKKAIFAGLKERLWKKQQGWKEKMLSRPGKEVLIKAVDQAIPNYMMSIFKLPDGFIDDIHSMLARFWWGSTETIKKIHWQRWESLCQPKALGGLGFKDLKWFNQAL